MGNCDHLEKHCQDKANTSQCWQMHMKHREGHREGWCIYITRHVQMMAYPHASTFMSLMLALGNFIAERVSLHPNPSTFGLNGCNIQLGPKCFCITFYHRYYSPPWLCCALRWQDNITGLHKCPTEYLQGHMHTK